MKHSLRNCHSSPIEQEKHKAPTSEIAKTTNFGEPLTTSHVSNLKEIADSQRGYDNPYCPRSDAWEGCNSLDTCLNEISEMLISIYTKYRCQWSGCLIEKEFKR